MKSDVDGCSTCPSGEEQWEECESCRPRVQYDYRHINGRLFTTIAPDLETARKRRDIWLAKENSR